LTETMRYGFTVLVDDDDDPAKRTTEVYSIPFDAAPTAGLPPAQHHLAYPAYRLLGANPRPSGVVDTYTQGTDVADWEVDDVGAGLLTGFASSAVAGSDTTGLVVRRSFATHVRLHARYAEAADAHTVEAVNGVAVTAAAPPAWALLSGTVYLITASKPTTCTFEPSTGAGTGHTFVLAEGASVALCAELTADRQVRYKLDEPVTDDDAPRVGYARTYTAAPDLPARLTLVAVGGSDGDGITFALNVETSGLGALQARPAGDHRKWDQIQARGLRRRLRDLMRTTANDSEAVAAHLPPDDDAAVAHVFEHLEWPATGPMFFGFDAARPLAPVVQASTGPVPALELLVDGGDPLDGTADLVAGQRVLLMHQADAAQNGVYTVATAAEGLPPRATDFPGPTGGADALVEVTGGATNQGKSFRCTLGDDGNTSGFQVDFSPVHFEEYVRWPRAIQVLGAVSETGDVSRTLLKTVQDGYHRYTFVNSDAVAVDEASGHVRALSARGGAIYLPTPISVKLRPVSASASTWSAATNHHVRRVDLGDMSTWEYNRG